jgi:hypothetical protein
VNPTAGTPLDPAMGVAVATQNLMLSMQQSEQQREVVRLQERAEDKSAKSLIRNLSPRQQGLFLKLCTNHMQKEPVMPAFITSCLAERNPIRATNLITQETRKWRGAVSTSGLARFLSGGYVSQEGNRGEPGGFTAFMFHPKSPLSKGSSTESAIKTRARIREFLDVDADEETVKFYHKRELFIPTNENELKIVIQTWHDLLVLLTVEDTIATEGLAHILEKFDDHYEAIQEMFLSVKDFGLTVLVILDNHLQRFFEMVSAMDDVTKASRRERDYLYGKANEFLEGLENLVPPSVVIPQCLRSTPTDNNTNKAGEGSPAKKKRKTATKDSTTKLKDLAPNPEPQQAWSIPEGKAFNDFFTIGGINEKGWPRLADPRFDSDRSMCLRFQVKGECTTACTLAHTPRNKMSNKQETDIAARFKAIYKN